MAGLGDTVAKRFKAVADRYPQVTAQMSKDASGRFVRYSFSDVYELIRMAAMGLRKLGVERASHVGIVSDNRREWLIADLALLSLGAVDVPRGSDSTAEELAYVLGHGDCTVAFVENTAQIYKIRSKTAELPLLKTLIAFELPTDSDSADSGGDDLRIIPFQQLLDAGRPEYEGSPGVFEQELEAGTINDVATIIYTSGTTGEPKGVVLTNRSYIFQLDRLYEHVGIQVSDVYLSVLPAWHSFERAVEYVILNAGAGIAYSKPVGSVLTADMQKVRPQWTAAVPRLWEAIRAAVFRNARSGSLVKLALFLSFVAVGRWYTTLLTMLRGLMPEFHRRSRILDVAVSFVPIIVLTPFKLLGDVLVFSKLRKLFGGRFVAGISGGGALPPYVDLFFRAAGLTLLEGYGLTETGPVLSVRKQHGPVPGTVGPLLRDIEARVVDADGSVLPPGSKGVLYVKSDQLMNGYYKRPDATAAVLQDGWLNTGDIVMLTHNNELKIIGRAKETIVLLGGENIEPAPIEDKLKQSPFIDQVMIVGQDRKYLGALIVPNMEAVEKTAEDRHLSYIDSVDLLQSSEIQELFHEEIQSLVNAKTGFKSFERIFRFTLLPEAFEVGKELTHTLKIRRNVVAEKCRDMVETMFR